MLCIFAGNVYCNATWDTVQCWGYVKAGDTVYQPCPGYISLSNPLGKSIISLSNPLGKWINSCSVVTGTFCVQMLQQSCSS